MSSMKRAALYVRVSTDAQTVEILDAVERGGQCAVSGRDEQGFPYAHPAAVPNGRCLSRANAVLVAPATRVPIICLKPSTRLAVSLLCHDIGYVRGACRGDGNGRYVYDDKGELVTLPDGSTDASLAPYHVTRSKLFVRERFGKIALVHVDTMEIEANIEHILRTNGIAVLPTIPGFCAPAI